MNKSYNSTVSSRKLLTSTDHLPAFFGRTTLVQNRRLSNFDSIDDWLKRMRKTDQKDEILAIIVLAVYREYEMVQKSADRSM